MAKVSKNSSTKNIKKHNKNSNKPQRSNKALVKKSTKTMRLSTTQKIKNKKENSFFRQKNKQQKEKSNTIEITSLFEQNIDNLSVKNKAKVVHKLMDLIISYPEENIDKLKLILKLVEDDNTKIVEYCLRAIGRILYDITPTYSISETRFQDKNLSQGQSLSKFQMNLQNFETKIIAYFNDFIATSEVLLKANQVPESIKLIITQKLGKLLVKFYTYSLENNISFLISVIIKQLNSNFRSVRKESYKVINEVLSSVVNSQNIFDLKLKIINQVSFLIYNKSNDNKLENDVMFLLNSHKVEFPDYDPNEEKKRMNKIEKQVQREINEYENTHDPKVIYNNNLKILKVILAVYFEFIKNRRSSRFIPNILSVIEKQIQFINVEILADLQVCINRLIKEYLDKFVKANENNSGKEDKNENTSNKSLRNITTYEVCMNAFKTNIKIREAISKGEVFFEDREIVNNLYFLLGKLKEFIEYLDIDQLLNLMDMVTLFFITNRQFNQEIVLSFIKRLVLLMAKIPNEKYIYPFLIMLNKIISMYPKARELLDSTEECYFNDKINDPSLSNGKNANIFKDIIEISKLGGKTKEICEDFLVNKKLTKTSDAFKNYIDLLWKVKEEEIKEKQRIDSGIIVNDKATYNEKSKNYGNQIKQPKQAKQEKQPKQPKQAKQEKKVITKQTQQDIGEKKL